MLICFQVVDDFVSQLLIPDWENYSKRAQRPTTTTVLLREADYNCLLIRRRLLWVGWKLREKGMRNWLADSSICTIVFADFLIDYLFNWLIDRLADWLIDWLTDWLIDRVDWWHFPIHSDGVMRLNSSFFTRKIMYLFKHSFQCWALHRFTFVLQFRYWDCELRMQMWDRKRIWSSVRRSFALR